ncbi:hypothetical protein C5B42_05025 [Candidatus Cerribacteria bacterium 'Amazon FNV 2010 28 9']|uniref:Uncharacterized protein n=1 Tax=Candidatus Cerribacteria bacterium 'Amazon FNV 2010 28 9' TaxID=2081795 RepID=A0A317JNU2_9BACT|nr:MAG: hypothetical protein C5B42_05025 [Candidatus Cerribacteria bacterium 'Amazon FNV 2010 28 9']
MTDNTREQRQWKLPTDTEHGFVTENGVKRATRLGDVIIEDKPSVVYVDDPRERCRLQAVAMHIKALTSHDEFAEILAELSHEDRLQLDRERCENSIDDQLAVGIAEQLIAETEDASDAILDQIASFMNNTDGTEQMLIVEIYLGEPDTGDTPNNVH